MMIRDALSRAIAPRAASPPTKPGDNEARRKRYRLWAWFCVVASAGLALVLLALMEPSVWRAFLVAFFLACPVFAIWGLFASLRPLPFPIGDVPVTRGRTFNRVAPYYDAACRLCGLGPRFRKRIQNLAQFQPGEVVLDIGCGTGVTTRDAAAAIGREGAAWGIDPAADMIRLAMVNAARTGSRARFAPGAIECLAFGDASIDVVILSLVLHLLPPDVQRQGLLEIYRVLKPGGRLLVVSWKSRRVEQALRAAGFASVTQIERWGAVVEFWLARKPAA